MRVYEFESKAILARYQINTPLSFGVYKKKEDLCKHSEYPIVAKIQIPSGKRGKRGGVKVINSNDELAQFYSQANKEFSSKNPYGILLEENIEGGNEFYVSLSYDSEGPILVINDEGGVEVESVKGKSEVIRIDIVTRKPEKPFKDLSPFLDNLVECFFNEDCKLLEINPLKVVGDRQVALDVKMEIDDRANIRHIDRVLLYPRSEREKTDREKKIDELNSNPEYSGGSPCRYVELDGDVALLLSGGGASLILLDKVVSLGLSPGNYSEYSGNPKMEKVEALTQTVLSKPNQRGLLVAGGVANFTLIDETLKGVAKVLANLKPKYPIVIRRGGPNEDKAKKLMLTLAGEHDLNIKWLGSGVSLEEACIIFKEEVDRYNHA